jgi:asparagine synthetase B (glutamine-hydrolysing)
MAMGAHLYGTLPTEGAVLRVDDQLSGDWPTSTVDLNGATITTSVMCPTAVYVWSSSADGGWLCGTDLFLVGAALRERSACAPVGAVDVVDPTGATPFNGVVRLPAHSIWTARGVEPAGIDPLRAIWQPTVHDGPTAGAQLLGALGRSVTAVVGDGGPPAVLLSSGVDSGAVLWTAHRLGLQPVAYSIGTPWGDEHDDAAELTGFLGVPHVRLDLTLDQLFTAIPAAVRQLGTAHTEKVDITLGIAAALAAGTIEQRTVLTGYGSDLLNDGLARESRPAEVVADELLTGLEDARHSSELSALAARGNGYVLRHPYWHREVVEACLRAAPGCKYGPREKQHLRAALAEYLPASVAWRRKIGFHRGSGLDRGMSTALGGSVGKAGTYAGIFRSLAMGEVDALLAGPGEARTVPARLVPVRAS